MSDLEPKARLDILDPAFGDPAYWTRFERSVVDLARPALAERRKAQITLEGVVVEWGRLVLPAMAAAVVALLLLTDPATSGVDDVAGVEEVLEAPRRGEDPLPSFLHSDESFDRSLVLLAVELR